MFEVKAKDVRELRMTTGAPMMDCKKALLESKGDMDAAVDWLRTKGVEVAGKKSGRDTSEGLVGVYVYKEDELLGGRVALVKCETDFVAKNEKFQAFVRDYAARTHTDNPVTDDEHTTLIATVGENVQVSTVKMIEGGSVIASYVHNQVAEGLGSIGVIVTLDGEPSDELAALGRDIAMHIAATNPQSVDEGSLDAEWLAHERSIFVEQAKDSGKPDNIIEKMVDGRMKKVVRENTLIHQLFVKDMDRTVGDILSEKNAKVLGFVRLSVGD